MIRQLIFSYSDGKYIVSEQDRALFSIDTNNMRFDALKFYNGLYKAKPCSAQIDYCSELDSKGKYVFNWVKSIIEYITQNCGEIEREESSVQIIMPALKTIKLYDLPACAGNGNYADTDSSVDFTTTNPDADYAVKISGKSMEPNIPDKCIVLVKRNDGEDCIDGEAYIIEFNGEVMCKRFKKLANGANFVADNPKVSFKKISTKQIANCRIQGKVIEVLYSDNDIGV